MGFEPGLNKPGKEERRAVHSGRGDERRDGQKSDERKDDN
jgi:hypothetical protein